MSLITPDFGLLFWMTLIFGIVFFLLAKFGFPMITSMVDKSNERINESIAKAKEAEESLARLAEQQTQMIQEARAEQSRILKEASEAKEQMMAKAREEAQTLSSDMIERAKTQIEAEKESALKDIRRQVSLLSVEIAEKLVRGELKSDDRQAELLDKLFDEAARNRENKS